MSRRDTLNTPARVLDARPDTLDFRDRMYEATLVEVPPRIDLDEYLRCEVPILDQGREGACTGFGLATVAHYLLRRRRVLPDLAPVSPRMLYELARRYDEWPGEAYEGSSARGAMKGWHKHGVCSETLWPYDVRASDRRLTDERMREARQRPLGAYSRVNHKDLVCMHAALAEVGILYATALVHQGWEQVSASGVIPRRGHILGGHAFALVAYDERGFWIQNSWGPDWGKDGFALVTYDDWLAHGTDVWVARLGVPVTLRTAEATATSRSAAAGQFEAFAYRDVRPHVISLGNDGRLTDRGTYGTNEAEVQAIFEEDIPRITQGWQRKRLLLYAHGGLVPETTAVQRVADYRATMLEAEVYPLAFIWRSDFWSTLAHLLEDAAARRRPEGFLDATQDFMLDRLDDALEPLARLLTGKTQWDEMKENALLATKSARGGARFALQQLDRLMQDDPSVELHVVGHSAGSVFHAPLVQLLTSIGKIAAGPMKGATGLGLKVASCTLWAPACTLELFRQTYLPAIQERGIDRFTLFTLTDRAEQNDHCSNLYHKSLLYLVSNAFEERPRIPLFRPLGEPLLGMEQFVAEDADLMALFDSRRADWIRSPNIEPPGSPDRSTAQHHGDFDDDVPTLQATLARVLERRGAAPDGLCAEFDLHCSASVLQTRRQQITAMA